MPPALSDTEASESESAMPSRASRGSMVDGEADVPVKGLKISDVDDMDEGFAEEGGKDEEDEEGDEDEEDLEEDEFIVEAIKEHMIDDEGLLKFKVKWEGYDKKADLTWEPEENLLESANEILTAYLESIGGRDSIFEESVSASRGKKRGRTSTGGSGSAGPKRSRKNGVHPADATPPASASKLWSPPAGSWEDEIEKIDFCQADSGGKLMIFLVWKNGRKTKHDSSVIYKKCPQKMLLFYESHIKIISDEHKAQDE